MGEQIKTTTPEYETHGEKLHHRPEHHNVPATKTEKPESVSSKQMEQDALKIIERTPSRPNPVEELNRSEKAAPVHHTRLNSELKSITLRRELKEIRRKLPAPQRAFSKVIHQPAVRVISEAASHTVSRPSGLLGGGLVAFIGTSGYLYLSSHYGLTYNYLVFWLLFCVGFAVGLVLELAVHLATASRRQAD